VFERAAQEFFVIGNGRIVDENVDAALGFHDVRYQLRKGCVIRDIQLAAEGLTCRNANFCAAVLYMGTAVNTVDHGAFLGELARNRRTDSLSRACDQRYFTLGLMAEHSPQWLLDFPQM